MTDVVDWGLLILAIAIASWFVILLFKVFFADKNYPKEIKVALIGAAATVLTILGAVKTTQDTNASSAALQRAAEVRKIKQQYYSGFFEAEWKKKAVARAMPENKQAMMEATHNFGLELARLPMYASQAFIEAVYSDAKGERPMTATDYYELMREDLCSDGYKPFRNLTLDTLFYPDPIDAKGQQRAEGDAKVRAP
jgi:hypothetical protein